MEFLDSVSDKLLYQSHDRKESIFKNAKPASLEIVEMSG